MNFPTWMKPIDMSSTESLYTATAAEHLRILNISFFFAINCIVYCVLLYCVSKHTSKRFKAQTQRIFKVLIKLRQPRQKCEPCE